MDKVKEIAEDYMEGKISAEEAMDKIITVLYLSGKI